MSNQSQAFVHSYLGPSADCPPTDAVRKRMRDIVLGKAIPNPLDAGAQSSPRNVPGKWPHAYALVHGVVTASEIADRFGEWVTFERDKRGLGSGGLYASPLTHVYKCTHFTVTQHWMIGALSTHPGEPVLSRTQAMELRHLILGDSVMEPGFVGPSRALGWSGDGLILDYLATQDPDAASAATVLAMRLSPDGCDVGVPWSWKNPNAVKDPNHLYECSAWMDGTNLRPASALYRLTGDAAIRDRLIHLLACLAYCQKDDGGFHDDWQPGKPGVFHDAPGESTELFIWPGLHEAKAALDDEWPAWAETMLNGCKGRYMALNRFRPGDTGFTDFTTMGIAIACAPAWGWRS